MIRGVRTMVDQCGLSFVEAVQMASLNPARALHLDRQKGSIAPGLDADLVMLTPDLAVRQTWVAGRPIHNV